MANEFVARNGINIGTSTNTAITSDGTAIYIKSGGNTYLNTANSAYVTNGGDISCNILNAGSNVTIGGGGYGTINLGGTGYNYKLFTYSSVFYLTTYSGGSITIGGGPNSLQNNLSVPNGSITTSGTMTLTNTSAGAGYWTAYVTNGRTALSSLNANTGYGLFYYQGTAGRDGGDSVDIAFNTTTSATSAVSIKNNGDVKILGSVTATSFIGSGSSLTGNYGGTITTTQVTTALGFTPVNYTHPAYTATNISATGASVLSTFTSDAIGSVTGISTRTLTLANLGYTGATNANYYTYTHPAYTATNISATGAMVLSTFTSDAIGSVTGITTRTLTLANLGYTGATNANYITATSQLSNDSGFITSVSWTNVSSKPTLLAVNGNNNTLNSVTADGTTYWSAGSTNATTTYGSLLTVTGGIGWYNQLAFGTDASLAFRQSINNNTSWTAWQYLLTSTNYNSYSPTLTGGGASGTWSINVTGSAGSATSATTAYNLTGPANTNGSDGWFRSNGSAGWYSTSYGGGVFCQDTSWVRVYNNFGFYVSSTIASTGDVIAYYSDERLKDKKGNIENALSKIVSLNGFYYTNNKLASSLGYTDDKLQLGLSAQEVQKIAPEIVTLAPVDYETLEDGTIVSKSGENYLTVNYSKLVPVLVESIKELKQIVDNQQKQIDSLLSKL